MSEAQRLEANAADWVIRLNYLNSMRPGEGLDVWVARTDLLDYSHWQMEDFSVSWVRRGSGAWRSCAWLPNRGTECPVLHQSRAKHAGPTGTTLK
jgi:hypothetical protein